MLLINQVKIYKVSCVLDLNCFPRQLLNFISYFILAVRLNFVYFDVTRFNFWLIILCSGSILAL